MLISYLIILLLCPQRPLELFFFFFNDPAPTEFYPLPLHAPLPIPLAPALGGSERRADRGRRGQRQQRVALVQLAQQQRHEQRAPRRRGPDAALAAAPGGLLVRRDERPVRRAVERQCLCLLVRGIDRAEVGPRRPDGARPHRGRRRTSASGWSPRVAPASPRLIATARVR